MNKIIIIDDVYHDICLIKNELLRQLGGDYTLSFYPDNENEFKELVNNLEMFFGSESEIARNYFETKFAGENILYIVDYHFESKRNFHGIKIYENIVCKLKFVRLFFFTAKSATVRDGMRKKILKLPYREKLDVLRKPYFTNSSGEKLINDNILKDEDIISLVKECLKRNPKEEEEVPV